MEDLLDLYAESYDPARPRVLMDEVPVQRVSETRVPQPVAPGQPARIDYDDQREGPCNRLVLAQPEVGFRHVTVTDQRTAQDFAHQLEALVDDWYPDAEVIRLVTDNLKIHTPASLYATLGPADCGQIGVALHAQTRQLAHSSRNRDRHFAPPVLETPHPDQSGPPAGDGRLGSPAQCRQGHD